MKVLFQTVVAASLAASLVGCVRTVTWKDAPPEVVQQGNAVGTMVPANVDGQQVLVQTNARAFPRDGKLGLCAFIRVFSSPDVSAQVVEGLALPQTTLTLKADGGGTPVVLSAPRFVRVMHVEQAGGIKALPQVFRSLQTLDKPEGGCVVTDDPWQPVFATSPVAPSLKLMLMDNRQRSQTVVGQPAAK